MRGLERVRSFLRRMFRSTRAERDLQDDVQGFADMAADELIAAGFTPDEARRRSLASMGGIESVKASVRAVRAGAWLEQAWTDFVVGLRGLRRSPGFAATAIAAVGLGVGANATMFSVLDSALLKPLPYTRAEELVDIGHHVRRANGMQTTFVGLEWPEIQRWRLERDLFQGVEAYRAATPRQWFQGDEQIRVGAFTPGLPNLLGVQPRIGRIFTTVEADDAAAVVVISDPFWKKAFDRRPEAIGAALTIDKRQFVVIGVMPATFRYGPGGGGTAAAWSPLSERQTGTGAESGAEPVFRLRTGLTLQAAAPLAESIADRMQQEHPSTEPWTPELIPIDPRSSARRGSATSPLWFLMTASGLVLLIACANVANLLIARGSSRQEELAMRVALGASRGRIVRLLLAEGAAVALLGGVTAVMIASWSLGGVTAVLPPRMASGLFNVSAPSIDWRVLMFAMTVTSIVALASSVFPALSASRVALRHRAGSGINLVGLTRARRRASRVLEAVQVALALVVAITCGLFTTSFVELLRTDIGFDARGLGVITFNLPAGKYPSVDAQRAAIANLLERVRATPGVSKAAIGNSPAASSSGRFVLSGETRSSGGSSIRGVGDNYFETTGIHIVAGRSVGPEDLKQSVVAVVDEADARRIFGSESPLGRRFTYSPYAPEVTIVGLASHVATADFAKPVSNIGVYLAESRPGFVVRMDGDLGTVLKGVRAALAQAEPGIRITSARAATDVYDTMETYSVPRFYFVLVSLFGVLALVTAGVGLYGLLACAVAQRRREIGVRVALGATPAEIRTLVLTDAFAPLAAGAAVGAFAAWWTGGLLMSLLYGVTPRDARAFVIGFATLAITAAFAAVIPVRRATGIDPIISLRAD
jgi:putative ABC transport system permease protein